jgi:hypothetical protein
LTLLHFVDEFNAGKHVFCVVKGFESDIAEIRKLNASISLHRLLPAVRNTHARR